MIEFKPNNSDAFIEYTAAENTQQTGLVRLRVDGTYSYLLEIVAVNCETAEGLIRSALNAAANRNAYICVYEAKNFTDIALRLGFQLEQDKLIGEIPILLSGCCNCNQMS